MIATAREAALSGDWDRVAALIEGIAPTTKQQRIEVALLTARAALHADLPARALTALDAAEQARFARLNEAYRERFGFPFIICVRHYGRAALLAAFEARLANPPEAERAAALTEIAAITRLRLAALVTP